MPGVTNPFLEAVRRAVKAIPRGQVRSYSQVALMAGRPGAARGVGMALRTLEAVPWWRVVRADGTLAAPVEHEQARRLAAEGVRVKGKRLLDGVPPLMLAPPKRPGLPRKGQRR